MLKDMVFEGFEPSLELKSLAKELSWYLEGRSPSQSTSIAKLIKSNADYRGELEISYGQGVFKADASNANAEECLRDLYKKALSQVKTWALSRSLNEQEA